MTHHDPPRTASRIAHDLGGLAGALQLIQAVLALESELSERGKDCVEDLAVAAAQLADLTRQVRALGE